MRPILLSLMILLAACSNPANDDIKQAENCYNGVTTNFKSTHPNSPALWVMDNTFRPSDFADHHMATDEEVIHINEFNKAVENCYMRVLNASYSNQYLDKGRQQLGYSFGLIFEAFGDYTDRKISRGEFISRYTEIKNMSSDQFAAIKNEYDTKQAEKRARMAESMMAEQQKSANDSEAAALRNQADYYREKLREEYRKSGNRNPVW